MVSLVGVEDPRLTGPVRDLDRFVGEICGVGTTSGTRVVIGRWNQSPFGPFADAMVEHPDGHRVLVAPGDEVAAYVSAVYDFDEVVVTDVETNRGSGVLEFSGAPLTARVTIGRRSGLGWVLRAVPRRVATSTTWATLVDPVARVVTRGVRTRGATAGGDEFYAATDSHLVDAVTAAWGGTDLGSCAPVTPPVRFGFSSAPRRPSIVEVTTTVRRR